MSAYLKPQPADEEVEDHHGARVQHPVGKVDGGAAGHLGHDALQDQVGPRAGERARSPGVGRVRDGEEHHVPQVNLLLLHRSCRGGGGGGGARQRHPLAAEKGSQISLRQRRDRLHTNCAPCSHFHRASVLATVLYSDHGVFVLVDFAVLAALADVGLELDQHGVDDRHHHRSRRRVRYPHREEHCRQHQPQHESVKRESARHYVICRSPIGVRTNRLALVPMQNMAFSAIRLWRLQCSTAIATMMPEMNIMVVSFMYSRPTASVVMTPKRWRSEAF